MRFHTLDAMRGFAAAAIVIYHLGRPNPYGFLAVDLFFVLSGFVLAHAYGSRLGFRELMIARLLRLYPMFVAGALVGLAIRGGSPWMLLMIPNPDHRLLYPANTALWSVAFEMIASVAFALFCRSGVRVWLAFWLGSGLTYAAFLAVHHGSVGFSWGTLAPGLLRMTFSFTTGIGLYHLFTRYGRQKVSRAGWLVALAPVAVTFVGPPVLAVFLLLPAIVLAGALVEVPDRRLASWFGGLSYPLYAIHQPIVVAFGWASIPFVVAGAALLERFYDRPVRGGLKALLRKSEVVASAP
jgi:peptidoglycan/LPS O-acetylase OafA/YrhL